MHAYTRSARIISTSGTIRCASNTSSTSSLLFLLLRHFCMLVWVHNTYVTTVPRDILGRAMLGTHFSAYFKREKDDARDILTAFKDRRRFLDISNYEKQKKKKNPCHMHFNTHQVTMGIKKSIKQQNSKQKRHIAPKSKEFRSWILRKVIDNGKNNSLNI